MVGGPLAEGGEGPGGDLQRWSLAPGLWTVVTRDTDGNGIGGVTYDVYRSFSEPRREFACAAWRVVGWERVVEIMRLLEAGR